MPEVVLKSGRVFEVEDENVSGQSHGVAEERRLKVDEVLGEDVDEAEDVRKRPEDVPDDVDRQHDEVELNPGPNDRSEDSENEMSSNKRRCCRHFVFLTFKTTTPCSCLQVAPSFETISGEIKKPCCPRDCNAELSKP